MPPSTDDELIEEIQNADENTTIDASQVRNVTVPSGTTLDGSGCTVTIDRPRTSILRVLGEGTTVQNITFIGHQYDTITSQGWWDYETSNNAWDNNSNAVWVETDNATVRDITASGFTHAGVVIGDTGDREYSGVTVANCDFIDNNARALGYGVVVRSGYPVIENCYFQNNRHDVACDGARQSGYEVRYCHFGDVGRIYGTEVHPPGGRSVHVHDNTFEDKRGNYEPKGTGRKVLIRNRGVPSEECIVENNWFKGEMVVSMSDESREMYTFRNNHEGSDDPGSGIGIPDGETAGRGGSSNATAGDGSGSSGGGSGGSDSPPTSQQGTAGDGSGGSGGAVAGDGIQLLREPGSTPGSPWALSQEHNVVLDTTACGEQTVTVEPQGRYIGGGGGGDGNMDVAAWDNLTGVRTDFTGMGPIGGGEGYTDIVTSADADITVTSVEELRNAAANASEGATIFIPSPSSTEAVGENTSTSGSTDSRVQSRTQAQIELQDTHDQQQEQDQGDVYDLGGISTQSHSTGDVSGQIEHRIHELTNEFRTSQTYSSLGFSEAISASARKHSQDMYENDYFEHDNLDGENAGDRLDEDGIEWRTYGENLAYEYRSDFDPDNDALEVAEAIVNGWIDSSGHRENLEREWDREGIGVHVADGYVYATQVFHVGADPDSSGSGGEAGGGGGAEQTVDGPLDLGSSTITFSQNELTIASDRGNGGNPGAMLQRTSAGSGSESPLLRITGDGTRVSGFRIQGPREDEFSPSGNGPTSTGLHIESSGCEIDNCEISGFTTAAVSVVEVITSAVHHNYIHDNAMEGGGVGVFLDQPEQSTLTSGGCSAAENTAAPGGGVTGGSGQAQAATSLSTGPAIAGNAIGPESNRLITDGGGDVVVDPDDGGGGGGGGGSGSGRTTTRSIITFNEFDSNQHCVDATGDGASFTFKRSVVGQSMYNAAVDVDSPGGHQMTVLQVTFEADDSGQIPGVRVNGAPKVESDVVQCWFHMSEELSVRQLEEGDVIGDPQHGGFDMITVEDCAFGSSSPSESSIGAEQYR